MDGVLAGLTDMGDRRGPRLPPESLTRQAVALLVVACLLAACTAERTTNPPEGRDRTSDGSPTSSASVEQPARSAASQSTPEQVLDDLPARPRTRSAATLAHHLDRVAATLRNPDSLPADLRRAGRFQQLAARTLATEPKAFRENVVAELKRRTARMVRGDVRAAVLLGALTTPQESLPEWRIVTPPAPEQLLGYYHRAERRTGVPWNYLAAIHLVETRMGRIRGVSSAGARGPMQFLPPTWELYGAGGDINDPRDAILAAARLLKANGAPGDMAEALWHYNPSDSYVGAVTEYAQTMERWRSAYRGYWHWRVLYRHRNGVYVLPAGYPETRAYLLFAG